MRYFFRFIWTVIMVLALVQLRALVKSINKIDADCVRLLMVQDSTYKNKLHEINGQLHGFAMYVDAQERQYNELVDAYQGLKNGRAPIPTPAKKILRRADR